MNRVAEGVRTGARPRLLPLLATVVLLPPAWLAFRLATNRTAIERMCLEATHYLPERCAPDAVLLRGLLALLIPALFLVAAVVWIAFARGGRAATWRATLVTSEREIAADIAEAVRTSPRSHLLAVVVLTALASLLRAELMNQPMRSDENQTFLLYSGTSLTDALWRFDTTNNHILFSVLARATIVLFGHTPWAARLPETVAGILLVPAAFFALRSGWGAAPALLTAASIAALPYLLAFSTNARGYSVIALCFLLAVPAAVRLVERSDSAAWTALVFLGAMGLLANVTGIYPFGALFAWIAWRRARTIGTRLVAVADVLAAGVALGLVCWLLYSPALTAMGAVALFANPWMKPPPMSLFLDTLLVTLDGTLRETWLSWGWGVWSPAWITFSALVVLAVVTDWRSPRPSRGLLLAIIGWSAIVAVASHRVPYVRVFIPTLPLFFAAAIALFVDATRRRVPRLGEEWAGWASVALMVALALALVRGAARTLEYT